MSRVFVLGAGASYAAGFPVAQDLFGQVYNDLAPEEKHDVDRMVRYLLPSARALSKRTISRVRIEELMTLLEAVEEFNEIWPTTFLTPAMIRRLRARLLKGVWALFVSIQRQAEQAPERIEYVDRFLARLRPDDAILTFNWDVLFERRARQGRTELTLTDIDGKIPFLKLHGSIDWFSGAELASRIGYDRIHRQLYRASWDHASKPDHERWATILPFIIPPTFFKTFRGCADMEEIWAAAFRKLERADEIYLCGYRFPMEDTFARVVFCRAIRANLLHRERSSKTMRPLKLIVVNPDEAVLERVKEIVFAGAKVELKKFEACSLV